ncbi:hypothetical protein QR680_018071 [Steinernema hermaphroditum]|uniref:Saposin B-type domain-containing protein n=1 Tax=Steinernema hermaphroditum TaxID=289476 RepID=A0AA39HHK0_9BILA|nr:hypothetical protein QR680_018071 [Steinernema hermaphroditum]
MRLLGIFLLVLPFVLGELYFEKDKCWLPTQGPTTTTSTQAPTSLWFQVFQKSEPNRSAVREIENEDRSYVCQLCLDMVATTKEYLECGRHVVQYRLYLICTRYFKGSWMYDFCRRLELELYVDVQEWDNRDPAELCARVIENPCTD